MNISTECVDHIVTNISGMRKVSARWIPRFLLESQKRNGHSARNYHEVWRGWGLIHSQIRFRIWKMGSVFRSWWEATNETMQALLLPCSKKFKAAKSVRKVIASALWDSEGVTMVGYLPIGHTITGDYYALQMQQFRVKIKVKRRDTLPNVTPSVLFPRYVYLFQNLKKDSKVSYFSDDMRL